MRRRVAISILGTTLDSGGRDDRWQRWRPTVALCQQPGLFIDRLEMIVNRGGDALADRIMSDIEKVAPATNVRKHLIPMQDAWDFSEVYTQLRDFAKAYGDRLRRATPIALQSPCSAANVPRRWTYLSGHNWRRSSMSAEIPVPSAPPGDACSRCHGYRRQAAMMPID
jgi:hypothetical protein